MIEETDRQAEIDYKNMKKKQREIA